MTTFHGAASTLPSAPVRPSTLSLVIREGRIAASCYHSVRSFEHLASAVALCRAAIPCALSSPLLSPAPALRRVLIVTSHAQPATLLHSAHSVRTSLKLLRPGFSEEFFRLLWPTSKALICCEAPSESQPRRHLRAATQTWDNERCCGWFFGGRSAHNTRHTGQLRDVEIAIAAAWRLVESWPQHTIRYRRTDQPICERGFTQRNLGLSPGS